MTLILEQGPEYCDKNLINWMAMIYSNVISQVFFNTWNISTII